MKTILVIALLIMYQQWPYVSDFSVEVSFISSEHVPKIGFGSSTFLCAFATQGDARFWVHVDALEAWKAAANALDGDHRSGDGGDVHQNFGVLLTVALL